MKVLNPANRIFSAFPRPHSAIMSAFTATAHGMAGPSMACTDHCIAGGKPWLKAGTGAWLVGLVLARRRATAPGERDYGSPGGDKESLRHTRAGGR